MKRILFFYGLLLSVSCLYGNSIQKVIYCSQAGPDHLQAGALELYFAQKPQFEVSTAENGGNKATLQIMLFGIVVKPSDLENINRIKGSGYQMAVRRNNNQYECVITYDPTHVLITYAPTLSMDMQHGIVVRFFDQAVLHKMRNQDKPVLCVACL